MWGSEHLICPEYATLSQLFDAHALSTPGHFWGKPSLALLLDNFVPNNFHSVFKWFDSSTTGDRIISEHLIENDFLHSFFSFFSLNFPQFLQEIFLRDLMCPVENLWWVDNMEIEFSFQGKFFTV